MRLFLCVVVALAAMAACGGSDGGSATPGGVAEAGAPALDAGNGPGIDGGETGAATDAGDAGEDAGPIVTSAFGLDARPTNTTCLAPARPPNPSTVKLVSIFDDVFTGTNKVTTPMLMAQRPADGSRWFLVQRDGRIVSFNATGARDLKDVITTAQLKTLTGKTVDTFDEAGFHGMVFDPDFATTGRLYTAFATTSDANVTDPYRHNGRTTFELAEEIGYFTSTDGGTTFGAYQRLLQVGRWEHEHYSGSVLFGKDGYLYISSGEGTDDSLAQHTDNFYGKVLRIDVKGTKAPGKQYGIPATNPFADGTKGKPEVYAWGLRNPYQMTIDRQTGEIWLGDVGESSWEEIDRIDLGGNYGWPCREGAHNGQGLNDADKCPSKTGFIEPIIDFAHTAGGNAAIGGYVYRGSAIPGFQGTYLYADYAQEKLFSLVLDNGTWKSALLNGAGPNALFNSFAQDASGELYLGSVEQNVLYKVVVNGAQAPSTFPQLLSQTGCVEPNDATRPASGVIPYDLNAALWSDGATKERFFAIPDGTKITVGADGDFAFPIGTVLMKSFSVAGKRIETRLFIRHADGEWAGYSYEWNDAGTDATLLPAGKTKAVGAQTWTYPSRSECLLCHTQAAGRSLGLEVGQLNRGFTYTSTRRSANELATLDHIGVFTAPLGDPAALEAYPRPFDGPASEAKARAYLHANCSGCHRPGGGAGRASMDLRFATSFAATRTCNVTPTIDDFGSTATRLVKPGAATQSIISLRMHAVDAKRMPPLARSLEDTSATALVDAWIGGLQACPP